MLGIKSILVDTLRVFGLLAIKKRGGALWLDKDLYGRFKQKINLKLGGGKCQSLENLGAAMLD